MINPNNVQALVAELIAALPPGVRDMQQDISKEFKSIIQVTLSKLDLVTREEFDTQAGVLAKTRQKLEVLEAEIAQLEGGAEGVEGQDKA